MPSVPNDPAVNKLGRVLKGPRWLTFDGLLFLLLVGLIAPFVLLSFFNHPQNDDYIVASHALASGYLKTFVFLYKAWSPRYFAIAGSILSPVVFKSFIAYKLLAALTICLMLVSSWLFVREFTLEGLKRSTAFLGALAMTGVYLFKLPAAAQSLYWFCGSICYQYGVILLLSALALALRARRVEGRRRGAVLSAGAALLLIAAGGTNELILICELEVLAAIVIMELWQRKAVNKQTLLLLGAWAVAATAVFLSPGIWVRHHQLPHSVWHSSGAAIESTASHLGTWLFATPLLPVFAMIFQGVRPQRHRILPFRVHPGLAFGASLGILLSLFFIPLYGAESAEERAVASIYFIFLTLFFLNCCIVLDHLWDRGTREVPAPSWRSSIVTLAVVSFLCVMPSSTTRTAYADVLSGRAYRFDREMWARYAAIRSCPAKVCEVARLKNWPSTIKFFDDAHDPKVDDAFFTRYKIGFAVYFGKSTIVVKP